MAKILGVRIDNYDLSQTMKKIALFLQSKSLHQIATVNPEFIVAAQKDLEFKNILNKSDLNVADGFGLIIAAFITGQEIGERITGVDLTWEIAKLAAERGYSIFLLGAKDGVAKKAAERLKMIYPHLKIAGTYAGRPDDDKTLDNIKKANPDILLVAFGAPKQDKFIFSLKNSLKFKTENLKLAIGVGGTFDYIAGIVPRAPKFIRTLGLEWLYRVIRQPSRLGRIYTAVIKFPLMVIFK